MKEINLSRGFVTMVDDEDYNKLLNFKWHVSSCRGLFYAITNLPRIYKDGKVSRPVMHMHRFIMGLGKRHKKKVIDHIDGNGLNNQKSNLRICTRSDNQHNRRLPKNASTKYIGVIYSKKRRRYIVNIRSKKLKKIKYFLDPEEAALWRDKIVKSIYGEFARLNFPKK